ncbi:MAG: DNA repair protein RadA [Phycisphaerales bacterium]
MPKPRISYVCRTCGSVQSRWMGKCPACGAWDALEEYRVSKAASSDAHKGLASEAWAAVGASADAPMDDLVEPPSAKPITESASSAPPGRIPTGISELDRVLGGGIVPGSAILLGGDPGIGKSTLLLQALGAMSSPARTLQQNLSRRDPVRTLYVTSEESAEQVRLRASRLGAAESEHLFVLADTNLARIVEQARRVKPAVLAIDSIQMVYKGEIDSSPGSITQLRRCCTDLVYLAKLTNTAVILVGHVTKDGQLAGPRLLEHLVDAVLYFEGDRYHAHRVVRSIKNRFGTTLEIGLFEMSGAGLKEVPDGASVAASALGGGNGGKPRPGSVVCPVVTGTRCVLVEMQALTATGFPGAIKRKTSGLDPSRVAMLVAVLEQHAGLRLYDRDVFASSVGGVRVTEPASDLSLALAIAGAFHKRALGLPPTAAAGEVGLGGEVRPISHFEARVREAARLGYKRLLAPPGATAPAGLSIEVIRCPTLQQAIEHLS